MIILPLEEYRTPIKHLKITGQTFNQVKPEPIYFQIEKHYVHFVKIKTKIIIMEENHGYNNNDIQGSATNNQTQGNNNNNKETQNIIEKGINFLIKLSERRRERLLNLLKKVQIIQKSDLSVSEKAKEIKKTLWTSQSPSSKLVIGGFLGTIAGLIVFGTGGIGIAALGSAVGVWGFLAGTTGGVVIASIIQNFEKEETSHRKLKK